MRPKVLRPKVLFTADMNATERNTAKSPKAENIPGNMNAAERNAAESPKAEK